MSILKKAMVFVGLPAAIVVICACERESRQLGAAEGPVLGSPPYQTAANVSAVAVAGNVAAVAPQVASEVLLDPAELFTKNCSACHQPTGQGIPAVFPPLDGSPYVTGDNVERMASIMIYGLAGPIKVLGTQYASAMAGLGSTLNDEQLAAIATYVRSSWSNNAPAVDASVFAAARQKWGSRGPFNIQELGEEP